MENINDGIAYTVGGHMYGVMGGDKIMAEFEKDLHKVTDTPELKPCPFCGSKDVYLHENTLGDSYVRCPKCSTTGPSSSSEEQAVKWWNMIKVREENPGWEEYIDIKTKLEELLAKGYTKAMLKTVIEQMKED